jgi:hypothetical protein
MQNPFRKIDLSTAGLPVESVATDVTSLLGAASFVEPFSGRRDPRAERIFESLVTEYCSGSKLILPVPKATAGEGGFFLDLWAKEASVSVLPYLEITDTGFEEMSHRLASNLCLFVEGDANRIAQWVAFQFTPEMAANHILRTSTESILRAGPLARELIENGSLKNFEKAISEQAVLEPGQYDWLIGKPEVPSVLHLCVAYVISLCLRRFSYALGVGSLPSDPVYKHHWIGNPAMNGGFLLGTLREIETVPITRFPWGTLLRRLVDSERSSKPIPNSKIKEVLVELRSTAGNFQNEYVRLSHIKDTLPSNRLTEPEAFVLDTMVKLGIAPRYRSDVKPEALASWLRGLAGDKAPWKFIVERVTANLQPMWIRKTETKFRIRFRRDIFWDIFDDAGLKDLRK